MPRHTQDTNSKDDDTRRDSVECMDSEICILTGKGFGYPPLIFVDLEHATNLPDSNMAGVPERPQLSSYV